MMKRILLLFLLILTPLSSKAGEPVVIVTNDYPPFVHARSREQGLVTDIVLAAFKAADLEVAIKYRPWRRCALMVENGQAFAAFPYASTDSRRSYAWFSDPIWESHAVFFFLKGRFANYDFTTLEDLRGHLIAGTSGNFYEARFAEKGLNVDYAPGEASGIRKLWEFRSEFFAESEAVGWALINRIFPKSRYMFGSTPTPWNVNLQRLMVSRQYPASQELLDRFNRGLASIRESGKYDLIVSGYLGDAPIVRH